MKEVLSKASASPLQHQPMGINIITPKRGKNISRNKGIKKTFQSYEGMSDFNFFMERLFLWASIIESSDDAIIGKNLNGIITNWNVGAEKIYGYSASEVIGKSITIIYPDDKKDEFHQVMGKIRNGEHINHYETERVKKDGSIIHVNITISPVRDLGGDIIGASDFARDITEKKHLETNLQYLYKAGEVLSSSLDYQKTLETVAELAVPHIADWCSVEMLDDNGSLDLVAVAHKDPQKVAWARKLRENTQTDLSASTGVPNVLRTGKPEIYSEISEELLKKTVKSKKEYALLKSVGLTSVIIVPICVKGKPVGTITFVSTETKRRFNQNDLDIAEELADRAGLAIHNAKLYKELQEAVQIRDDFIAIASHELKTPITSLKIYTQVLQQHSKSNGWNQLLPSFNKINVQIEKLMRLIGDLLNVSKVQSGRLELEWSTFNMYDLVKEIIESIQPTSTQEIRFNGKTNLTVYGDKDRLGQIIINLLTNAIKYSPKSDKIVVKLNQNKQIIFVSVQDFGIGIDKKYLSHIFEQFYQVNDPEEKTFPGLGIGLYISREIARRHGGDITVDSQKGQGSTFTLTLPKKRASKNI